VSMNQLGAALTELGDPPVMSLYVCHSNPAAVTPDQNAVIKGLERNDREPEPLPRLLATHAAGGWLSFAVAAGNHALCPQFQLL
jgi:hypothetical protein